MRYRFPDGQLGTWACLGAVTDRSVRVWLRDPDRRRQVARLLVDGEPAAETELRPHPDHDHVSAANLTLPRPAAGAEFAVEVGEMVRRGRLAPADGQPAAFAFGFGSCHEPFGAGPSGGPPLVVQPRAGIYEPLIATLRQQQARFLLLIGDQIYSDGVDWISVRGRLRRANHGPDGEDLREIYRELYYGYFNQSGFRALLEGWPTCMMWDDHDIYDGYGSLLEWETGPYDEALFQAAEVTYREYQHLHNPDASITDARPYHYHFWYGDTGFFVFDLRGERDYRSGVLLGSRQRADFSAFLEEADARGAGTVFIGATVPIIHVSPAIEGLTQWLPGSEGKGVRDRWTVSGYRTVRDEVLDALFDWQARRSHRQVIILSGDVHVGAAFRLSRSDRRGVLRQWTSSPLSTSTSPLETIANWVGTTLVQWGERRYRTRREALVLRDNNFGLVEVQPRPTGGHDIAFKLLAFSQQTRGLRVATHIVARPRG